MSQGLSTVSRHDLGRRIRARRQLRGLTLKELSDRTGLSLPYHSDIERRGDANPTLETLNIIADALEIPLVQLLGGDAPGSQPLSISLQRFIRSDDFAERVARLAQRAQRDEAALRDEVISFLAAAPKRSTGELTVEDCRRLLVFYTSLLEG
jgi:transcriptional regulator with XRE-family HTH domain